MKLSDHLPGKALTFLRGLLVKPGKNIKTKIRPFLELFLIVCFWLGWSLFMVGWLIVGLHKTWPKLYMDIGGAFLFLALIVGIAYKLYSH